MGRPTYDKSKFFDLLKEMQEYQVGDEFFVLKDQKILKGNIHKISTVTHNMWSAPRVELNVDFLIYLNINGSVAQVSKHLLYKTREEVAEKFLQDNDVPSKLLQVIMPQKSRTTVECLIEKLQTVDPAIDLTSIYGLVIKRITEIYLGEAETDPRYWDCECEQEYIHNKRDSHCPLCNAVSDFAPDSRVVEITGANMYKGEQP